MKKLILLLLFIPLFSFGQDQTNSDGPYIFIEKNTSLLANQLIIQICLFLVAAISLFGGALQMYLGEPETTPE